MTFEEFSGVLRVASRFLPPENDKRAQKTFSKFRQMDVPAIVSIVKRIPEVSKYRGFVSASLIGVEYKEVGKALIPFLELYYPSMMTEIIDDEVLFAKFRDVVHSLVDEFRSGS